MMPLSYTAWVLLLRYNMRDGTDETITQSECQYRLGFVIATDVVGGYLLVNLETPRVYTIWQNLGQLTRNLLEPASAVYGRNCQWMTLLHWRITVRIGAVCNVNVKLPRWYWRAKLLEFQSEFACDLRLCSFARLIIAFISSFWMWPTLSVT